MNRIASHSSPPAPPSPNSFFSCQTSVSGPQEGVEDPLKYDVKIMLGFLFGVILVLFVIVNWGHLRREGFISLPQFMGGQEIANVRFLPFFTDNTCGPNESMEGGLCYTPCRPGYYGRLTMCVAESHNRGVGTVVGLEDCPQGFNTEGLICREPLRGGCRSWWDGCANRIFGRCLGGLKTECQPITGGRLKGRLDGGGKCPGPQGGDKPERYQGMCYSKCPTDKPVPMAGLPYLCYKGGALLYDRGVGKLPYIVRVGGKYGFLGR